MTKTTRVLRTLLLALALLLASPSTSDEGWRAGPASAEAAPPPRKRVKKRQRPRRAARPPKKPAPVEVTDEAAPIAAPVLQRSNRMELDARLVRGETPRSGAVYLFQRAPRRLPPLVTLRQSYLDEIVLPVLGAGETARARERKR